METASRSKPFLMRLLRVAAWTVITPILVLLTALGSLFLYYSPLPWSALRSGLAVAFLLGVVAAFILLKPRVKALLLFAVLFGGLMLWFQLIPASNDRPWQPDVARTAHAEIDGDRLTMHNVRNFHYRSESDYDQSWETRTYDLAGLRGVDFFFSYWGSPDIAHTMLSFGFDGGEHLCVSVETRKQLGQTYSPVASFFKQFELIYLFGDERDLVALRTNHRGEDTYLFPRPFTPEQVRVLLLDIVARANSMHERPEYYRTIRDNCTTSLVGHVRKVHPVKLTLGTLFNGTMPRAAYDAGNLPTDAPFEEVMQRFAISAKGRACGDGDDYSRCIRGNP